MPGRIYQLRATIVGTKPPVWRRMLVPEATTPLRLHEVLQAAFAWWDSHLHEFEIDGAEGGPAVPAPIGSMMELENRGGPKG